MRTCLLGIWFQDVQNWVKDCKQCQTANGPYTSPNPQQGSIIDNKTMNLLCVDFNKMDQSKDGRENILLMTHAFFNLALQ